MRCSAAKVVEDYTAASVCAPPADSLALWREVRCVRVCACVLVLVLVCLSFMHVQVRVYERVMCAFPCDDIRFVLCFNISQLLPVTQIPLIIF